MALGDKSFRVTANFPVLGENSHQVVIVPAATWTIAAGKAARQFKRMDIMRRRRVMAMSMIIEQMASENIAIDNEVEQPVIPGTQPDPQIDSQPATEEIVMEQPSVEEMEVLNQQANDEAESLIEEGPEIDSAIAEVEDGQGDE